MRLHLSRHGRLAAILIVSLFLTAPTPAVRAADNRPAAAERPTPMAKPAADALLEKALNDFLNETEKRLDSRMGGIKGFFEDRKAGAPLYASEVLGLGAKGRLAGSYAESFFGKIGELFGVAPSMEPDSFLLFVRRSFREKVLEQADVERAVDEATRGFLDDIAEAEGQLLVVLNVDVDDDAIGGTSRAPDLRVELAVLDQFDGLTQEVAEAADGDLKATAGMFVVSAVVSNEVSKHVTPEKASKGRRLATDLATGLAVDEALSRGAKALGHDPETAITGKVKAGLDQVRVAIIDGDPDLAKIYPTLSIFRRTHPDEHVRLACQRADEAVVKVARLGVKERLRRVRNERYRTLWKALMTALAGEEAARSPFLMYTPLDPKECSPPEEIIRWADDLTGRFTAQH